jgi:hypothetical protein
MSALTAAELREQAIKAKRLKTAAGEREAHSLADLIAMNEHIAEQDQQQSRKLGVRMAKVRFGGPNLCRE